jgi:cytochrome oxidase assembly protein ShyY1
MRLGFWQLERAEEKRQWLAQFERAGELTEPDFSLALSDDLSLINGRSVNLAGSLNSEKVWLIDNKVYQGKVGYDVVVRFRAKLADAYVWLNLGWVAAEKYRDHLPDPKLPEQLQVTGVIKSQQFNQLVLKKEHPRQHFPKRIQSMSKLFELQPNVLPLVIHADSNTVSGMPQIYEPSVMPPEKHQGYAVQWFLLAFFSVLVFLFASRRKHAQTNHSDEDHLDES